MPNRIRLASQVMLAEYRQRLPADPGTVFDHLIDAELLTRWWPSEGETDPRPGGEYRLHWAGPDVTLRGVYEVVDRPRRLRYTWKWDHEAVTSTVSFELAPTPDGSDLVVQHTAQTADERDDHLAGWSHFLPRLAELLGS